MTMLKTASRWLAYTLFVLAAGLVTNTLLGPLFTDTIRYHYGETLTNQGIAVDLVALFGAAPIAILAGILELRRHRAGPVLAFIPATFTAYMAPQYVIGPDYLGLPGNNEQFFPFHVGLFVLAVAVFFLTWEQVDRQWLPPASRRADRSRAWVLFGVAAFIALGRWLPGIADLMSGNPAMPDYSDNPTSYLLVGFLDLGLVTLGAVTAGIGLRVGARWAREAAYAVIGWFALVPASVAAMNITMLVNDDPNAIVTATVLFVVAGVIFTTGAALLYGPLFGKQRPSPPSSERYVSGSQTSDGDEVRSKEVVR